MRACHCIVCMQVLDMICDSTLANCGEPESCPVYAPLRVIMALAPSPDGEWGLAVWRYAQRCCCVNESCGDREVIDWCCSVECAVTCGYMWRGVSAASRVPLLASTFLPPVILPSDSHSVSRAHGTDTPVGYPDAWYPHGARGGFFNKGLQVRLDE